MFGLTSKSRSSSGMRSEDGIERADLDLSQPVLERAMDDLFNPHTIAKQTILNILGVRECFISCDSNSRNIRPW